MPNKIRLSDKIELIKNTEQSLYFAFITTYAQGMALLQEASKEYKYELNLAKVASIWRGGCIIRANLLEANPFRLQQSARTEKSTGSTIFLPPN